MLYSELIERLTSRSDKTYAAFHSRLLHNDSIRVIGVRVPELRKLAKELKGDFEEIFSFPDEYYEVTFLKLTIAALLPYEELTNVIEPCVAKMNNWATCDCFAPKCIRKHRAEFLPYLERFISSDDEFAQRFALVCLLQNYVDPAYYDVIERFISLADLNLYYVHMAAAWLLAELLVKDYEAGKEILLRLNLPKQTHNKAIQKARESFRLSQTQKDALIVLKK